MVNPLGRPRGPAKFCTIEGCERRLKARGWCAFHYQRWQLRGDPMWEPQVIPLMERFESKFSKGAGCWLWAAGKGRGGYGKFGVMGTTVLAHRFAYEVYVGEIPEALTLDHLCRTPACVRPDHLEPVTLAENVRRASSFNAAKTHCPRGHEYTNDNIYRINNSRRCATCQRARNHAYYHGVVKVRGR